MKLITNEEYARLKTNQVINAQEALENKRLLAELEDTKADHAREVANLKKVHEDEKKYTWHAEDNKLQEKTKELNNKIQELTISENTVKKENEILRKAFENMGFDVKDMKEILNKLVEGIVSKNTVNVVK